MDRIKVLSLQNYLRKSLFFLFFSIICFFISSVILLSFLMNSKVIYSVDAGEIMGIETAYLLEEEKRFDAGQIPDICKYIYYDKNKNILESNVSTNEYSEYLKRVKKDNASYRKVSFPDESYCYIFWNYKNQFVNPNLRKILPNVGIWWGVFTLLIPLIFIIVFIRKLSNKFSEKLSIIVTLSNEVKKQNLDFPNPKKEVGIKEFDDAIIAMIQMKEALKESLEAQWLAENQRMENIASVSHDLKTPLTIISANTEMLLENNTLDVDVKEEIEIISNNTRRLNEYVATINTVFMDEIEEEKVAVIVIDDVLKKTLLEMKVLFQKKELKIVYDCQITQNITGKIKLIERALFNILENAYKYSQNKGNIYITAFENDESLIIEIRDQGSGFTDEGLKYAQEFLWKQDKSRTDDRTYGIGLSVVNNVMKLHGGSLIIENWEFGASVTMKLEIDDEKYKRC